MSKDERFGLWEEKLINGLDLPKKYKEQLKQKKMSKETYTEEQVITIIKSFHLDSVEGNYSKELLMFCNNWINNNIINNPEDERNNIH